jgi:large subunit ribosomal protein L24
MSRPKFHVKKGDEVTVLSGNHRGASGKVLQVLPKKEQVLVEGVRLIKKTQRKSQDNPNGAIITREGPIHISNVKLVGSAQASAGTTKTRASKPARKGKE